MSTLDGVAVPQSVQTGFTVITKDNVDGDGSQGDLQVHVLNAPLWGRPTTPAPRHGNGTEVEDQCL